MILKFPIAFLLILGLTGCNSDSWSASEKNEFLEGCREEGGSKAYCKCYLEKTMAHTPVAEEAEKLSFETKVELSKDCE